MLAEVLFQRPRRPQWIVGETKAERVERMRSDVETTSDQWYPGTYPRRVCSIRKLADVESGKLPSLSDMAGDMLSVRVLDVTEEQYQAASESKVKVKGQTLVPITFRDRFGAVAKKLYARHADPEAWEIDERERVEADKAENETRMLANDRDAEEYRALKEDFG